MIKTVDENGMLIFTLKECKQLIKHLGFTSKKRRKVYKIFNKHMRLAMDKFKKENPRGAA